MGWITLGTPAIALLAACGTANTAGMVGADDPDWHADEAAYSACETVAAYAADGYPDVGRQQRMDAMNTWAAKSINPHVIDQAAAVARTASGPDPIFRAVFDDLAGTCLDLGFTDTRG